MRQDHPISSQERLALAGILCFLVTTATCVSCVSTVDCSPLGVTAPQQHELTAQIKTTCIEPDADGELQLHLYRGSGVVVSSDQVITAAHVVQCGENGISWAPMKMTVSINGIDHDATLEIVLPTVDLARIVTTSSWAFGSTAAVTVGGHPKIGQQACTSAAFPRWNYRCGEVQPDNAPYPGQPSFMTVSMHTEFGNSGSGVWVDGKLIGILVTAQPCQDTSMCEGGVSLLEHYKWLVP